MKILITDKLGFCYGVKRAIKIAEDTGKAGNTAVTLGPIIHNPQVVAALAEQGVGYVNKLDDVKEGIVIIRSHGVGPSCYNRASEKNLKIIDATCPFVLRAQKEAHRLINEGKHVIIFGEKDHPEVKSISEWAQNKAIIAESPEDLQNLPEMESVSIVSQTTFSRKMFKKMLAAVSAKATNVDVHETICHATAERQEAVIKLAEQVDVIIVIGGKNSANTGRLAEISALAGKRTYHIETAAELQRNWFDKDTIVGITAGASTPDWIIEEVLVAMDEMKKTFEEMEMDYDFHKGSIVEGTVVALTDEEAYVSFGYKTEAILVPREYSFPAPTSLKDVLAVGDTVRAQITNTVKEDNPIYISKLKLDRAADWDVLEEAKANDEAVECVGLEAIKAGLLVQVQSLRGFIPLSQGDLRFVRSLSFLVNTKFKVKVLEIDRMKNRLVLSRKAVLEEHRDEEMENMKASYEKKEVLRGIVKKIMPYGAFIDVNGIEGLLHISDIAWSKIDKVEDVLEQNQEIDVIVKDFNEEKQRISFSHKDTYEDPWYDKIDNHTEGSSEIGTVVNILDFGAIVELDDKLTGLLHISEIPEANGRKVSDVLQVGDSVEVQILDIKRQRKRISFSLVHIAERGEEDTNEQVLDENQEAVESSETEEVNE